MYFYHQYTWHFVRSMGIRPYFGVGNYYFYMAYKQLDIKSFQMVIGDTTILL
jgi:outer membrane protein W